MTEEGSRDQFTALLGRARAGDPAALNEIVSVVYSQLRAMAAKALAAESARPLCTTELVHEVYLRLAAARTDWQDRAHFFAIAARLVRSILVDHARSRLSQKRGGRTQMLPLEDHLTPQADYLADLVALDSILTRFSEREPRKGRALELVYFGGLSYTEAAQMLQISEATLHRELKFARAWIHQQLNDGTPAQS